MKIVFRFIESRITIISIVIEMMAMEEHLLMRVKDFSTQSIFVNALITLI